MAKPSKKLVISLGILKELQEKGTVVLKSSDLSRTHRERLMKNGFLSQVLKGWYLRTSPDGHQGDSSYWYTAFWEFCTAYLEKRFGEKWSLSPEQSISLHVGNWTVPKQLMVRAPKGRNKKTSLLFKTSIFELRAMLPDKDEGCTMNGVRLFSLPSALCNVGPSFFSTTPHEAQAALASIKDSSELLQPLLKGDHSVISGRLAGGFRFLSNDRLADEIIETMRSAGYTVRETNPFKDMHSVPLLSQNASSAAVYRLRSMWYAMRDDVVREFPSPPELPRLPQDAQIYLRQIEEKYTSDAYHSLSIEGFHVSEDLIQRVQNGQWDPEYTQKDSSLRDALAARGYWLAFQEVEKSISRILQTKSNPGFIVEEGHRIWYRSLFSPCVQSGIIAPQDLAGYRRQQVYIRNSMHIPARKELVFELMQELFRLLQEEKHPAVRAVLGHFIFVYIHPYMDGNGRIGRFLMNTMLASGKYPWTIVHVEQRGEYMEALEIASVENDIRPFTRFIAKQLKR